LGEANLSATPGSFGGEAEAGRQASQGRPEGLTIDLLYAIDGQSHRLVIPVHRIAEEANELTEDAAEHGGPLKQRDAVWRALRHLLARFDTPKNVTQSNLITFWIP
jgi:hypothetical protein